MADGGDNIFVYLGGEHEVPRNVTHVIIDRSVKIIPRGAFDRLEKLVSLETHDGIDIVEGFAFFGCDSLKGIKLPGVREIGDYAFCDCSAMTDVEFGDKLETIGEFAFCNCSRLRRIAIPLKDNMLEGCSQFDRCANLITVDLVGVQTIHNTIASLLLESWRDEMNQEIVRINQVLPNAQPNEKTGEARFWIRSVINRMEHYEAQHNALLKEDMTQLELAVWKAKLDEKEEDGWITERAKNAKIDVEIMRKEKRITSGADTIITNVLPFLQLAK